MKKIFSTQKGRIIVSVIVGTLAAFGIFYFMLPPINPFYPGFWLYLAAVIAAYAFPFIPKLGDEPEKSEKKQSRKSSFRLNLTYNILPIILIACPVALMLLGQLISSTVFNAKAYANVITVKEAVFADDMKETNEVTNIALMDGASARYLGNKTLGSLSHVVSQYVVSENYTQINYKYTPKKVANLEYDDFFKWLANKEAGIPGYVMVDPVNNSAEYMELKKPMKYVDSAFFGDDLMRKLRFSYPTMIFDSVMFEIDDEGNPYYIVSCLSPKVFPFGAMDVSDVIIFDPCTGDSVKYAVDEVPAWVDAVYSGNLAEEKYNWYGTLSGGFINSIIGNKDCKQTTDDYGYIIIGDDVWYYTGVTSVTSDESNIGFIISNARTGEYKYYPVVGAEEHGAMRAAEGEVQEKGYSASFPSLINVSRQATYIMVLKDATGYVKLYALVNVEQPSIVATAPNQSDAMKAYKELLVENGVIESDSDTEQGNQHIGTEIVVKDIKTYTIDGNTVFYIYGEDVYTKKNCYYKGYLKENENLIFISNGDLISVVYYSSDNDDIKNIVSFEFAVE